MRISWTCPRAARSRLLGRIPSRKSLASKPKRFIINMMRAFRSSPWGIHQREAGTQTPPPMKWLGGSRFGITQVFFDSRETVRHRFRQRLGTDDSLGSCGALADGRGAGGHLWEPGSRARRSRTENKRCFIRDEVHTLEPGPISRFKRPRVLSFGTPDSD